MVGGFLITGPQEVRSCLVKRKVYLAKHFSRVKTLKFDGVTFWTLEKCIPFKLEETLPEYTDIQTNMDLESLFGGSSRRTATCVPWTRRRVLLCGDDPLLRPECAAGRMAHGAVREEGDTRPGQPDQPRSNPGDQWGDNSSEKNQYILSAYFLSWKN